MSEAPLICHEALGVTFLVRRPIFDRNRDVWGYEVDINLEGNYSRASVSLCDLVSTYQESLAGLGVPQLTGKKLYLNIGQEDLLPIDLMQEQLEQCVFGVNGKGIRSDVCGCFADTLHLKGGCVAVDCTQDAAVVEKADIVKVSIASMTPLEVVQTRKGLKGADSLLLAADVGSWEAFEGTRALGFNYFQGPFFSLPEVKDGEPLEAGSMAKLQLLKELNNPACEMEDLSSIIATDVSLSYRVLKYINSVAFGLKNTIKSIQQAVSLLGLKELRHWATVVVMSDLDTSPKGEELAYMALQRARFLSNLAGTMKQCGHSQDTMFMLGLFSKLDALMAYPMEKALQDIPLEEDIKSALCGTLNDYRDWLLMLEAVELGNWEIANSILGKYGACFTDVATQYMKAASWAARQLPEMRH